MTLSARPSVRRRWVPRLVLLDWDGTLATVDGRLSAAVRDAVRSVVDAGSHVVIATGRSTVELEPAIAELGLTEGFAVCSNGAVTTRLPDQDEIRTTTFDPAPVLDRILQLVPSALVAVEEPGVGYAVTSRFPDGELHGPQTIRPIAEMLARPAVRVIVRDPQRSVPDFLAVADQLDVRGVSYAVGYKAWLDLGPEGVTKGTAVAQLAVELGVAVDQCLAIGDGRNDVEMLQWAGRGVAMGQAPQAVKDRADAVTNGVHEDGAAIELQRWFGRA